jgi:DNA mismatch repair ATPase MutS
MEKKADLRLKLQVILSRLGCTRRADLCQAFHPSAHGYGWLLVYLFLLLLVPASIVAVAVLPKYGVMALVLILILNSTIHEFRIRKMQKDFDTVNYSVAMIFALRRVRKLKDADLDHDLRSAYESLDRLRAVIRTGGVSGASDNAAGDAITTLLLLDLIAYEFLKNKLGRNYEDVFSVHEGLGRIDAAIAVASYRKSLDSYAKLELDFSATDGPLIEAHQMVHPLIEHPVPNDLTTDKPVLVTGSNASGKSTYLKTAALCAAMAQSICTCTAEAYRANAFRIYTSMALSDDLLAGESYYIVETKSLKRILDATKRAGAVLCVIDEVLRGTNTVERIAASSEVLLALSERGALCLAATHDIEMCMLLQDSYRLCHFEETISEDDMLFDYVLHEGPAGSRNAINLLRIMGFDDTIVENAHERANRYLDEGVWR